jgi:hypothetical protein
VVAWLVLADPPEEKPKVEVQADAEPAEDPEIGAADPDEAPPEEALVIAAADPQPEADAGDEVEPDPVAGGDAEAGDPPAVADAQAVTADASAAADDAEAADPGASEAAPKATERSPTSHRSAPRKTASKATVVVHVRLSGIGRAELKIGKRTIKAMPHFDGLLPVGRHRVRWRERADGSWQGAGSFKFVEGSEYLIRVSTNGPRLETR